MSWLYRSCSIDFVFSFLYFWERIDGGKMWGVSEYVLAKTNLLPTYPGCQRFSKRRAVKRREEKREKVRKPLVARDSWLILPHCQPTLGARGFLREEPWRGEKRRERRWENLWLPATVDWSYRTNRFELGSRSDPASWLEQPNKRTLIGLC